MFKKLLEKYFVFLDGGMGTMIQSTGVDAGHIPELLNITNPDIIKDTRIGTELSHDVLNPARVPL